MTYTVFQLFIVDASQYMIAPLLQPLLPHQKVFARKKVPRMYGESGDKCEVSCDQLSVTVQQLTCVHQEPVYHFFSGIFYSPIGRRADDCTVKVRC